MRQGTQNLFGMIGFSVFVILSAGQYDCNRRAHVQRGQGSAADSQGESTVKFLTESTARPDPPGTRSLEPPTIIGELAMPLYPTTALAHGAGRVVVVVRIVIGVDGRVTDIQDSPRSRSGVGVYAEEFSRAIRDAVIQWKFVPAELQFLEDGKDLNGDGKPDYKIVVSRQTVPVYSDVQFEFRIVSGRGRVATSARQPASDSLPVAP